MRQIMLHCNYFFNYRDTVVNSLMKESEILNTADPKIAIATPASVSPMMSPDEMTSHTEAVSITQDGSEATQSMTNSIDTHTPIDVRDYAANDLPTI